MRGKLSDYRSNDSLTQIGLVKRLCLVGSDKYYRISVADNSGNPLLVGGKFSADVWLFSRTSFKSDIKRFSGLLKNSKEFTRG